MLYAEKTKSIDHHLIMQRVKSQPTAVALQEGTLWGIQNGKNKMKHLERWAPRQFRGMYKKEYQ